MQKIINPVPLYLNSRGNLLDGGRIYIGAPFADPETQPLQVYYDKDRTIPAAQPIKTIGGQLVNENLSPTFVYVSEDDYSIRVRDADLAQINYVGSVIEQDASYQPLDDDLTAIAALGTTTYGRNLLTLASQAALRSATGIPDCLPVAGGTISGSIVRQGAGVHPFHADPAMTGGRIYVTATGAADPTSQPGDIWFQVA